MRLTPSGKGRYLQAQQALGAIPQAGIEQKDITFDNNLAKTDFNPIGDLENKLKQQQELNKVAPVTDGVKKISEDAKSVENVDEKDMEDAYFDMLSKLGITAKISDPAKRSQLFSINVDLMQGNAANGFFLIPEYIDSERINQSRAQQIAKDFANNYGVTKLTFTKEKYNYKFNFSITPKQDKSLTNSSLDAVLSGEKKSAFTKNLFIKESKNSIINSLVKKGFGGK